jgi:transcriptional regulator with XRE-family HTH domain
MQIVQRVFQLLEEQNKDQRELAHFLSISPTTVSAWKKRSSDIPSSYISAIADFLNVSCEYILTGKKNTSSEISEDEEKILKYYRQLTDEEHRDYIKGEMVRLHMTEETGKGDVEFADELAK